MTENATIMKNNIRENDNKCYWALTCQMLCQVLDMPYLIKSS